jgi:magnesium transporter
MQTEGEQHMGEKEYGPDTAGDVMSVDFIRLDKDMSVHEALQKVRSTTEEESSVYALFVTDDDGRLEGFVSLRRLLMSKESLLIRDIMKTNVTSVTTDATQEEASRKLYKLDLYAIAVVDENNMLAGIITAEEAMEILEEEATEDIFHQAGIGNISTEESDLSEILIKGSLKQVWRARLPVLFFVMLGGLAAGFVMGWFEETLHAVIAAAFFIPVIMDMGGSTGIQSATIFTRAYVLGHIDKKKFNGHLVRETSVGFTMGVLAGLMCFVAIFIWQDNFALAAAVSVAVMCVMTLAAFLGFILPYILIKLKIDQVTATGAILTTIKDITGLLIYFALVSLFIGVF